MKQVTLTPKQQYAIGRDTKSYEYMSYLNGKLFTDVIVIDPRTGEKKKVVEKLVSLFGDIWRREHQPLAARHALPLLSRRALPRL